MPGRAIFDARFPVIGADQSERVVAARLAPWGLRLRWAISCASALRGSLSPAGPGSRARADQPEVHERQALLAFQQQRPAKPCAPPSAPCAARDHARWRISCGRRPGRIGRHADTSASIARPKASFAARSRSPRRWRRPMRLSADCWRPAMAQASALALVQRAIALDRFGCWTSGHSRPGPAPERRRRQAQRVAERARATARTATERETVERLLAAPLGAAERPN